VRRHPEIGESEAIMFGLSHRHDERFHQPVCHSTGVLHDVSVAQRPVISEAQQQAEIVVQNLCKSFNGNDVLRGVNFVIQPGDIVAIVGDSGCGKTVLLRHLIGQIRPDSGDVWLANHEQPGSPLVDLNSLDNHQMDALRVHWAVVFQRNALLSGTVYENIHLWLSEIKQMDDEAIRQKAIEVLSAVGLDAQRVLNMNRSELSGGMAKRVAVARALAMDPILIFYDEPTTGLDPKHGQLIHDLIYDLHIHHPQGDRARTTVIITHDKDLLTRLHPRIIMLHEGRVFFDGPHEQFARSESEVVRPYFDLMPLLHRGRHAS
jgi:phospholipid/cholesterol/gamma-HCH transport system ATP-binding protein